MDPMNNERRISGLLCVLVLLFMSTTGRASEKNWHSGAYLDLGYTGDFNDPENGIWRSKGTSFEVNEPRINMAMVYMRREATVHTRWGLELGLQGGVDTKPLALTEESDRVRNAEELKYLRAANASYLLGLGNGLSLTGGLFSAYIGHESFDAIHNPTYTRGYLTDNIPYFLVGLQAAYPLTDNLDLSLHAVTGYNYLENVNDVPGYGLQIAWAVSPEVTFTQNLYYGPDQSDTDLRYWRFFSDSILEWARGAFLLAAEFYAGTEKQADVAGNPTYNWMAGAVWAQWNVTGRWNLGFRPEFYSDPDGVISGSRQAIQAYTTTVKYNFFAAEPHRLVAGLEYRYDRSRGDEGGYYEGVNNRLVPETNFLILALMGSFDS
jgi:hypothetical protein